MLRIGRADVKNNHANDIRILTKECPANILANNRIPKLTALAIYDTNSIRIINGVITKGVPVGNKIAKYLTLCNEKPNKINVVIVAMLKKKVSEASDVVVSSPGTIPNTLATKIDAWIPEMFISLSSHSLSAQSSSS